MDTTPHGFPFAEDADDVKDYPAVSEALALAIDAQYVKTYKKITAKAVNNSVVATDLLNGEFTIAANDLADGKFARLVAFGDYLANSGASVAPPRFQVKLAGATLIDALPNGTVQNFASRMGWRAEVDLVNLGGIVYVEAVIHMASVIQALGAAPLNVGLGTMISTGQNTNYGGQLIVGYNANVTDMTIAQALRLDVVNGAASVNYETKLAAAMLTIR